MRPSRLVWTNEESPDGSVTRLTFEEKSGKTLLVMHERYPSKGAFEASVGAADGMSESFDQLDMLLPGSAITESDCLRIRSRRKRHSDPA